MTLALTFRNLHFYSDDVHFPNLCKVWVYIKSKKIKRGKKKYCLNGEVYTSCLYRLKVEMPKFCQMLLGRFFLREISRKILCAFIYLHREVKEKLKKLKFAPVEALKACRYSSSRFYIGTRRMLLFSFTLRPL